MNKKLLQILCLLVLVAIFTTAAPAGTLNVNYVAGTQNNTSALTGFSTDGSMMAGMAVKVTFTDASTSSGTWATTGPSSGAASGTGWSLAEVGDTFGGLWTLTNTGGLGIASVAIDAGPGNTVFDTTFGNNMGTNGSALGWDFGIQSGGGSLDVVATYMNCVALTGDPCVGDIFRNLNIDFTNAGGFGAAGAPLVFIADTDNIQFAGDITPVPEPATLALFGAGLAGLAARRFKKR